MGVAKAALECASAISPTISAPPHPRQCHLRWPHPNLAARGISGLGDMLKSHAERALCNAM